jgi:hypothetical protein
MKNLTLLAAMLMLAVSPTALQAQGFECGTTEIIVPQPFSTCVSNTSAYRPDPVITSRFTPMREVRIVYHVFLKEPNDPQGINPNNPAEVNVLENLITDLINERLENGIVPE